MAASAAPKNKMAAVCAVLVVLLLSGAAQPAMALLVPTSPVGTPDKPTFLLGLIQCYFDNAGRLVYTLQPGGQCTYNDRKLCYPACYTACNALAVHVVCNAMICKNAGDCTKNFSKSCEDACTTVCNNAFPGN